ncbi:MAG: plasmid recombination protein, partial [Oscillospiraceae bacterium]|nr:plasmid recombination protein [Oscillospiraceae bacterium]
MKALSASFVLGKLSTGDANVAHNNRETIAGNVDVTRIADNIIYIQDDVRDVYDELFGDALEAYNAKQKQPCRRIHDYFEHVSESRREEAYYELVIQFGDMKTAGVGSENGELAKKMLDEYARSFQERNPNLRVFSQNLHMDEASPH